MKLKTVLLLKLSKGLSKYIVAFDYFDKSLIVLSGISGGISVASFATVISFAFSLTPGITKETKKNTTPIKKKQHK